MLERAFLRRFFDLVESMTVDQISEKIAQVEKVKSACVKGSEGYLDARYMLKHLHQRRLELVLQPGENQQRP